MIVTQETAAWNPERWALPVMSKAMLDTQILDFVGGLNPLIHDAFGIQADESDMQEDDDPVLRWFLRACWDTALHERYLEFLGDPLMARFREQLGEYPYGTTETENRRKGLGADWAFIATSRTGLSDYYVDGGVQLLGEESVEVWICFEVPAVSRNFRTIKQSLVDLSSVARVYRRLLMLDLSGPEKELLNLALKAQGRQQGSRD